jgi:hypothetical protein
MIEDLLSQLKVLVSSIRKNKAVNINGREIREAAISIGSFYFKNCRSDAQRILGDDKILSDLDEQWQQLIRLAHGNNPKKYYLSLSKQLLRKTTELAVASHTSDALVSIDVEPFVISYSQAEQIIVKTLDDLLPSAAQSYRQGVQDLNSGVPRFSFRGTASELREALRETLDYLAPDGDITKQSWFKLEPDCKGPTMKQKVRFILSSRGKAKAQRALAEKTVDLIENLCGEVARAVYTQASISTHVQTTMQDVQQMKRYLDAVLFDILEIGDKNQIKK